MASVAFSDSADAAHKKKEKAHGSSSHLVALGVGFCF
jgi:hypothetical protein